MASAVASYEGLCPESSAPPEILAGSEEFASESPVHRDKTVSIDDHYALRRAPIGKLAA